MINQLFLRCIHYHYNNHILYKVEANDPSIQHYSKVQQNANKFIVLENILHNLSFSI